ncbi:hypothetical protein C500_11515 [Natrialba magadii ATCC 43099]|uniref:Transmembrane glycoprotein / HTH domain protein n=1 Tax=Natrialba magadii (strain ATCC 43099 / DSM 3394 / CCM 3739 / CIP 104546 / IAM 13178 / JCM 8861 / NBRC 102185 / NCIMB 2190 / MS3) TaxID=547559 RepID=L9UYY6_NATMM|nr:hypothetical protein C500_11515 [Natrialba magadii ATCC 43099]
MATAADAGTAPHSAQAEDQFGVQDAGQGQYLLQEGDNGVGNGDEDDDEDENDEEIPAPEAAGHLDNATDVHISISLHENGTATFTVDYRFEDAESAEWQQLRDDVEENPDGYVAYELDDWETIRAAGENETGREMAISNGSVTTDTSSTPQELGHVTFSFQWSSFAYVELNQLEAGDALVDFTLVEGRTLHVFPPEDYIISDVDPASDDPPEESVRWNGGETEFMDDQPWIVMIENGESTTEPVEPEESPAMPWLIVGIALGVLAAAGAGGWWYKRRTRASAPAAGSESATNTGDESLAPPAEPPQAAGVGSSDTAAPDSDADVDSGSPGTAGPDSPASNGPPPELLSNEERVLRLLKEHGGRIKQQQVVSELEWTEAKTSQVVGGLREDDAIDVFRIGRENVLALPDDEDDE